MKHIASVVLSIITWIGAVLGEIYCGFALLFTIVGWINPVEGLDLSNGEFAVMMVYFIALFLLCPIISVAAFRMRYRHYVPEPQKAKTLTTLALITFVLLLPSCYYTIRASFYIWSYRSVFFAVSSILFDVCFFIASITICFYVFKHSTLQLNDPQKKSASVSKAKSGRKTKGR